MIFAAKISFMLRLYISISFCFLFTFCNNSQKSEIDSMWDNTTEYYLKGKPVSVNLPASFKESSRYRIKQDMPELNKRKSSLYIVQEALANFEEKDKNVNLYIDTLSDYHFVTILDAGEKIQLDKTAAARLGKVLMEDYEKMELNKRGIKVTRLESNIKKNNVQKMVKFKFEIKDTKRKETTYATSFFITNSTRTLIIHEFSDQQDDLEYYTWSIKENY